MDIYLYNKQVQCMFFVVGEFSAVFFRCFDYFFQREIFAKSSASMCYTINICIFSVLFFFVAFVVFLFCLIVEKT